MHITRMLKTIVLSALASLATSSVTLAHHGAVTQPSLYLTDDFIELRGEIVDVLWRNPHTRARMLVAGEDGEEQMWEIEISPGPRTLERLGINEEDLFGPARAAGYISRRDPDSLGALHVLLPDGREYAQGNRELLWEGDRVASTQFAIDPERAAEERRTATGHFQDVGTPNRAPASNRRVSPSPDRARPRGCGAILRPARQSRARVPHRRRREHDGSHAA